MENVERHVMISSKTVNEDASCHDKENETWVANKEREIIASPNDEWTSIDRVSPDHIGRN